MADPDEFTAYQAASPATPPEQLAAIAEHRPELRHLVAANPAAPHQVLDRLAASDDVAVAAALRRREAGRTAPRWDEVPLAAPQPPRWGSPGTPWELTGPTGGTGGVTPWTTAEPSRRGLRWAVGAVVAVVAIVGLVATLVLSAAGPFLGELFGPSSGGSGPAEPTGYGEDAYLDGLWDDCAAGTGEACDVLYEESPVGSEYEEFAASCGGRFPGTDLWCVDLMD